MRKIACCEPRGPYLASPSVASRAIQVIEPDEVLITRTLRGDLGAFERLVERHREVVFRVASRIVGRDDAEDVSQDAFLRAFARLERFRGESTFRTWLLQITQRVAFRSVARSRRRGVGAEASLEDRPDRDSSRQPATELERRERQQRLEVKLSLLHSQYRALIVLRDLEGLSYAEIATILDMPIGSVKGRLHRARGELIELLRNNTYDWELPA
jgi:RNA polymerase sigma-70 factor, ECF subfamily